MPTDPERLILPLYDPHQRCPKCDGNADASFVGLNDAWRLLSTFPEGCRAVEVIRRKCCCGYVWYERPLDQVTEQEAAEVATERERARADVWKLDTYLRECGGGVDHG